MARSADEDIDSKFPTNIVVQSDGSCKWVPIGLFISSCTINIRWFPFDDQKCEMKFGSWSYDSGKLNLTLAQDEIDMTNYQTSGEWIVLSEWRRHAAPRGWGWGGVEVGVGEGWGSGITSSALFACLFVRGQDVIKQNCRCIFMKFNGKVG